jgi:hypothetical protein
LGDDAVPDPGFAVGRVEEDVGEVLGGKSAVTKLDDFRIQARADAGYFGLRYPGVRTECFDEIIDLAGGDAVDVGLHHDREQCLVDAAAALQQGGKNDPARNFGIRRPRSPAVVVKVRSRAPLRWVVRSAERSKGEAPMNAVASASISSW